MDSVNCNGVHSQFWQKGSTADGDVARRGGRGLFIKLLVAESKPSQNDEMEKEGTEKIGSEKLPIMCRVKGKMELKRFGMQDQR